jgi:hypothetical protein
VCLTAVSLEFIHASALASQPDILRKELDIPESLNTVTGIALGYPNPESILNTYRSPSRPLQEVIRYKS